MKTGAINIGVGICLTTIAGALIAIGIAFADIKKGVEAYNKTQTIETQLTIIRTQLDTLMIEQEKAHISIDKKLDYLIGSRNSIAFGNK